jgi:hypothetical protein
MSAKSGVLNTAKRNGQAIDRDAAARKAVEKTLKTPLPVNRVQSAPAQPSRKISP